MPAGGGGGSEIGAADDALLLTDREAAVVGVAITDAKSIAADEGVDDRAGMCRRRGEKNARGGDTEGSHGQHPRFALNVARPYAGDGRRYVTNVTLSSG